MKAVRLILAGLIISLAGLAVGGEGGKLREQILGKWKASQKAGDDEELKIMAVVLKSQYMQERLSDVACDLYAASCTLARLDHMMTGANGDAETQREVQAGRYFLALANRRIQQNLAALWDNDDDTTTKTADVWLRQ